MRQARENKGGRGGQLSLRRHGCEAELYTQVVVCIDLVAYAASQWLDLCDGESIWQRGRAMS